MTPNNDVNIIFENNSVKEIESILIKMRNDIEKKKEELRIMVGERYRDLIEAADTISEMRRSAEKVCKNLQTMESLCGSLQQRGLIGFKTRGIGLSSNDSTKIFNNGYQYSVAVQVKLLVTIPEVLWELTESKNYLDAAQLLLLAQQCYTALQLSQNGSEIFEKFPVVSRQWTNISHFKSSINHGCIYLIKNEIKDFKQIINAVATLILIEGIDMESSFKKFLMLRKACLQDCLNMGPSTISKNQLVNFVISFISTFSIIQYMFIAEREKKCLLETKICEISGEKLPLNGTSNCVLPLTLLQETSLALSFLPKSILDFRPKPQRKISTMTNLFIQSEMQNWLCSVVPEASETTTKLLGCITSIKSLSFIRDSLWEAHITEINKENWRKLVSMVLGKSNAAPWEIVVRKESLIRAKHLVKKELEEIRYKIVKAVKNLTDEILSNTKVCQEEGDITEFLWSESLSDLPDQMMWNTITSKNMAGCGDKIGLFYKSRGYTRRIQDICKSLNSQLNSLLEDVAYYSPAVFKRNMKSELCDESSEEYEGVTDDYNNLLLYLEEETIHNFKIFVNEIGEIAEKYFWTAKDVLKDSSSVINPQFPIPETTVIVTIGRLCQAIPVVCQQLKICTCASHLATSESAKWLSFGLKNDTQTWMDLNDHFTKEAVLLLTKYLCTLTSVFGEELRRTLRESIMENISENLLTLHPIWEKVYIEEENELGMKIKSSIFVPSSPTPLLSQTLTKICEAVNFVCPHTVPRLSQMQLVTALVTELLSVYEDLSANVSSINQNTGLQIIFDLKLIQNVFLPRENKELGEKISSLIQKLEYCIDPFDMDVLLPHFSSRIKIASQRLLVILGTIIPKENQPLTLRGPSSSSGNNTLPIVPSLEIPRFSNVPLPTSGVFQKSVLLAPSSLDPHFKTQFDHISVGNLTQSSTTSATPAKSTASSILSAMSTSWFGS